jgi:hypothetical protein
MTVAADPDPYFALPSLYGAPAYGRAPRAVVETERPPDPDDLPIAAEMTEEERALAEALRPGGYYERFATLGGGRGAERPGGSNGSMETADGGGRRRFSLRVLGRRGQRT